MKITAVEPIVIGNPWKNWILLRVETNSNIEGIGEATLEHRTEATVAAVKELSPYIIGWDPADVEQLAARIRRETYTPGIMVNTVLSGFEMACWDILGKHHGEPVHRLLGGQYRKRIPVYANGWYRVDRTPDGFASAAQGALSQGFRALKFDPFGNNHGSLTTFEFQLSLNIIEAVANICERHGASIIIEGHGRFDVPTAKKLSQSLANFSPLWFEEPIFAEDIAGLPQVYQMSPIPIATGERLVTLTQFNDLLQTRAVDIIQPDVAHVGGLWAGKKIAHLAEAYSKGVTFHTPLSPVVTAASLQLAASCPNATAQECFDHFNPSWVQDVFGPPPSVIEGGVEVSLKPGLGIDVNWDEARKHPFNPLYRQNYYREGWERRQGSLPQ